MLDLKASKHPLSVWGGRKWARGGRVSRSCAQMAQQSTGVNHKGGLASTLRTAAAGALVSLAMVCLPAAAEGTTQDVFAFKCAGSWS